MGLSYLTEKGHKSQLLLFPSKGLEKKQIITVNFGQYIFAF